MSIRKRVWKTSQGEERQAWILDFFDGSGKRRHETFARRKDAEQREAQVRIDVSRGAKIPGATKPSRRSPTIGLITCGKTGASNRRSTITNSTCACISCRSWAGKGLAGLAKKGYRHSASICLPAWMARTKSPTLARSVWVSFKTLLKHARIAHLAQGVKGFSHDPRAKRKLEIGKDVPSPAEIKRLYEATGR